MQTPLLILLLPLPSHSVYVVVLSKCRPPCWSCCHFCLPTASTWSCFQTANPLADPVATFAFPQGVCDCAFKLQTPLLILLLPLPSHSMYVIMLSNCRPPCWSCCCLCLLTGGTWLCFQTADPLTDPVAAFAFPQHVCDCAFKLQIPLLIPLLPLPSHSMYVIVHSNCIPPHWSCCCLCLPTVCMWSCFQTADPLTDPVAAFAFLQEVHDHAFKLQTPSLIPWPPLPSHSVYVTVLSNCRPPCWSHCHLYLPTVCMWSCFQTVDPLTDPVATFAFPQYVSDHAFKLQTPLLIPLPPLPSHRV